MKFLEFAWCSLRASMEFSTISKNNFGVDFFLHCCFWLKLPGPLFDRSAAGILQKGIWQDHYDFSGC